MHVSDIHYAAGHFVKRSVKASVACGANWRQGRREPAMCADGSCSKYSYQVRAKFAPELSVFADPPVLCKCNARARRLES